MSSLFKNQRQMLEKLGIPSLNEMQQEMNSFYYRSSEMLLLSPTGSGKTLAFLLPMISELDRDKKGVQALIMVPSRELAMQIEQVARNIGAGYKIDTVYGGRRIAKEKEFLQHAPAILIGTPGRLLDHLSRGNIDLGKTEALVIDEFDKCLEVGFHDEMQEIYAELKSLKRKVLCSASKAIDIPDFMEMKQVEVIDFLHLDKPDIRLQYYPSVDKDKLKALAGCLEILNGKRGVVFCNFKASIDRVSDYLFEQKIPHGVYHGSLDQQERDRVVIKFRNGTHDLLLATDLAARGLDIPEIDFIIHYHLPSKKAEFIHRNGRTARMKKSGMALIIKWNQEKLPDYLDKNIKAFSILETEEELEAKNWETIKISAGRRDKISKGDIAGFLFKKGKLKKEELGLIELKQECAFVAVAPTKLNQLLRFVDQEKIKKRKVRVTHV